MMNIMEFSNNGMNVRAYKDADQNVMVSFKDVCFGLGFTKKAGSGNLVVNYTRANSYLSKFGMVHKCTTDDYIPESMFYLLAMKANNETARRFQVWIATDVLPAIRKHGAYMTEQTIEKALSDPDFLIQLATQLKEEKAKRKELETKIDEQKPLVTFAETCLKSSDSILVRELAKICCDEGINIGEKRLYKKLREWNMIFKNSTEPYQRYIDNGCFVVEEKEIKTPYGVKLRNLTKVSPKGQVYIIEKLKEENK